MKKPGLFRRIRIIVELTAIFFRQLMISAITVAKAALAKDPRRGSSIVAVPLYLRTDFGIALLANLETLTPGTCSLHVSEDRSTLYLHTLDGMSPDDAVSEAWELYERRIQELRL